MKKLKKILAMVICSLLFVGTSTTALAAGSPPTASDGSLWNTRNKQIVSSLKGSSDNYSTTISNYFSKPSNYNANVKLMDQFVKQSKSKVIYPKQYRTDKISDDITVHFYDDGSFVIQNKIFEAKVKKDLFAPDSIASPMDVFWQYYDAEYEIYNAGGAVVCKIFVDGVWTSDGTTVSDAGSNAHYQITGVDIGVNQWSSGTQPLPGYEGGTANRAYGRGNIYGYYNILGQQIIFSNYWADCGVTCEPDGLIIVQ